MAIVKTEAVLLKCSNYRETSKIITFFTKDYGKIKCIAKGVRDTKSRWGGALQSMAHLNIIFYYKENRTLHLLSGADHCCLFRSLYQDYDKIQVAYRIIELVERGTTENHPHTELFTLLSETLKKLDDATKNFINLLFNFEFNLAKILGFGINTNTFELNKNFYRFKPGYPADHLKGSGMAADENYHFSEQNIGFFNTLKRGNFDEIMAFNIEKPHDIMLEKFFERHFEDHFENLLITKTKKVIISQEKHL